MKKFLLITIVFAMVACEKPHKLASIAVVPKIEAYAGHQTKLQVYHAPIEAMAPDKYIYNSSDEFIATITDEGIIVCHQVGTCVVTVSTPDKRFSSKCVVTVKDKIY